MLTLFMMKRDQYKTVTTPILINCEPSERDGGASFLSGLHGLKPVRILRDKDLEQTSKTWKSLNELQRQELIAAALLVGAIYKQDRLAATNAYIRLEQTGGKFLFEKEARLISDRFSAYPESRLDEKISGTIERRKACDLEFSRQTDAGHIHRRDEMTALFTKLLLNRVSGKGLAVCPQCGVPFVQKRPNQDYCSIQHREAHRVARWRASKKSTKKRGKHGTRKAR